MKNVYFWIATSTDIGVTEFIAGSEKSVTKKFRKWLKEHYPEISDNDLTKPLLELKEMFYDGRLPGPDNAYVIMYKSNHYFENVV